MFETLGITGKQYLKWNKIIDSQKEDLANRISENMGIKFPDKEIKFGWYPEMNNKIVKTYFEKTNEGLQTKCKRDESILIGSVWCIADCKFHYAMNFNEKFVLCKKEQTMKPIFENEEELIEFLKDIIWQSMPMQFDSDKNQIVKNIIRDSLEKGYIEKSELEIAKEEWKSNSPLPPDQNQIEKYICTLENEIERLKK